MKRVRCAIYTRKSSEEGLEQEFNSLHAQREACEAFIQSQKAEGWQALPQMYDDGGLSGGTLERPALQRLLDDIDAGKIDQIVVYKIDRLTRSLADFAKIVDRLDAAQTSFVSVTQSFNTATSMGRLTLNMLLSFAQFEREVTAERIRDKIAASKRKGLWMGGQVPFGYDAAGRTLTIRTNEAETVRMLYGLYQTHKTVRDVQDQAKGMGLRTRERETASGERKGGHSFERGHIYQLLTNPIYAGKIRHKSKVYEGQHPAIIEPAEWEAVQVLLQTEAAKPRSSRPRVASAPLKGKVFDETGDRLTPSHTKKSSGKRLHYYVSLRLITKSGCTTDGWRLPAAPFEAMVAKAVHGYLASSGFRASMITKQDADAIARIQQRLDACAAEVNDAVMLDMCEEIRLGSGQLTIRLKPEHLTALMGQPIDTAIVTFKAPFKHRKKGVETRFIIGETQAKIDTTLVANIAKARDWFKRIKKGESYAEIARTDETSKRHVQRMIDLAFLAPDIVRDVCEGKQPLGLTTEWLKNHPLPSDWTAQRAIISTL